jgi:imidazolonepropionase-like amidohydrolase
MFAALALSTLCTPLADTHAVGAGERGGAGLALIATKALTSAWEGEQVIDHPILLVKDGLIEAIGAREAVKIPAGYIVRDVGDNWLMAGMIDLHSHCGGTLDINDLVYQAQPEFRVSSTVIPANDAFKVAVAGGVTSVLYIPGSGSNCGGQGVLLKTGLEHYDEALIRDPGSLKVAQWGNPEGWTIGVGKTFENYTIRQMFREGLAYARRWRDFEEGKGEQPERDPRLDVFRDLLTKKTQVSTHTQPMQVILETLTMIRGEFGVDVYIDHGEWDGYMVAELAQKMGVSAILGPRNVEWNSRGFLGWNFQIHNDGAMLGIAAEYQRHGMQMLGFNTDSLPFRGAGTPPAEELFLQAAIGVRYGLDDSQLATVRGLTIIPAKTAGIDHRVGSLEVGKDADIVVIGGHPADPRSAVELVYIDGRQVYDTSTDRRRF